MRLRLAVCLKQVPDTSALLRVDPGRLVPPPGGHLPVPNPYDEFALEEALQIKDRACEQGGAGAELSLFTVACEPVDETVFHGLAMGADRASVLQVEDSAHGGLRPLEVGEILAREIRSFSPDIVFCGARAVDDDAAQVGAIVAERLGLPQVSGAESISLGAGGSELIAKCRRGAVVETVVCPLPCLVTFVRGARLPRYASMAAVFSAQSKPVHEIEAESGCRTSGGFRRVLLETISDRRRQEVVKYSQEHALDVMLDRIGQFTSVL